LYRVICWTPRWFNKPKFHFIIHLPAHIRRFGPAVLFATETFESYNAIIRGKSVHSNHQSPSRDIALAFAHYSRVRHLLSGGRHVFRDSEQSRKYLRTFGPSLANPGNAPSDIAGNAGIWRQVLSAGPHLRVLFNKHSCYVGPSVSLNPRFGTCVLDKQPHRPYAHTDAAHRCPTFAPSPALPPLSHSTYLTARSMTLLNGDVCRIGDWVLFYLSSNTEAPALGRIHEILISTDVVEKQYPRPDIILLQQADISEWVEPYRMPRISASNNWAAAGITVSGLLAEINTFLFSHSRCYVAQTSSINAMVTAVSHQDRRSFTKNGRQRIKHAQSLCTRPRKTYC
jgi:hypothetical protein